MEIAAKQYKRIISNASEIAQVLLDMEGGKYVLTVFSELVQEFLDEGNIFGTISVVQKLYEVAELPIKRDTLSESDATAWVTLFATALGDALEESIF